MGKRYSRIALLVGRQIEWARQRRGITLIEAAARARITKGYWSTVETGNSCPSIGALCKMAKGLGVPIGDLIPAELTAAPTTKPEAGAA